LDGEKVGECDGTCDGASVGSLDGEKVGVRDGACDGTYVGETVGAAVVDTEVGSEVDPVPAGVELVPDVGVEDGVPVEVWLGVLVEVASEVGSEVDPTWLPVVLVSGQNMPAVGATAPGDT